MGEKYCIKLNLTNSLEPEQHVFGPMEPESLEKKESEPIEKMSRSFNKKKWPAPQPRKNVSLKSRAGETANILAAPSPDFTFKRLRLPIFFPSGSDSLFF